MAKGDKTPEEIAADEEANRAQREQLAREANKKRNDAQLEARNAIADSADEIKDEEEDLVELTDEQWDQEDRQTDAPRRKTRAERLAEQEAEEEGELTEEEAAARLLRAREREDKDADVARDAGADDSRRNKAGQMEYRVEINGEEKWLTVSELRAHAGQAPTGDDAGQRTQAGDKTPRTQGPTPEQLAEQRQAAERKRTEERQARKAKLIDLHTRASMGDEEAIAELADIQADSSRVTPDEIERMVDSRVAARVQATTAFERDVAWFESDAGYGRELKAPGFKQKAAQIDARLAKEHPELSSRARLDRTGKELRRELAEMAKYLGAPAGTTRTSSTTSRPETKLQRKQNAADEVPRASGRPEREEEPDERMSASEAIANLAKQRGQARAIKH